MSDDRRPEFCFDEEDFDPDPFGYDRSPPARTSSRKPHRRTEEAPYQEVDSGSTSQPADDGSPQPFGKNSYFSVPDPWPDTHRAAPSEFLRCGLYAPRRRNGDVLDTHRLESNANVTLTVSGPELSQLDFDTWLAVIHLLRCGSTEITRRRLAATWPRARGGNGDHVLRSSLERLSHCDLALDVQNHPSRLHPDEEPDRYRYEGCLIDQVEWQDGEASRRDGRLRIALNPELAVLFERRRRTILLPGHRAAIGHNPVALWLYGVIRSHREVLPRPIPYYHRMCRSGSVVSDFAQQVKRALELLAEQRIIYSAELRRGMLFIQRQRPVSSRQLPAEDTEWFVRARDGKSRDSANV